MRYIRNITLSLVLTIFSLLYFIPRVSGLEINNIADAAHSTAFMVAPVIPKDNIGGQHLGYFNLKVSKGETKQITVQLVNPTAHNLIINIQTVSAQTNDNGSINYTNSKKEKSSLLADTGTDWVGVDKKIQLNSNSKKKIKLKIKIPAQGFIGQRALALNFIGIQDNKKSNVKNKYVYAIGLILNGQKSARQKNTNLTLNRCKIRLTPNTKKPAISVQIKNEAPYYHLNSDIKTTMVNQKWHFIQYNGELKGIKIAPSTQFYQDILLGGKRLNSGIYKLKMNIKTGKSRYSVYKYVRITHNQASFINRNNYLYLRYRNLIILTICIIISITGGLFYFKKRRNHDGFHS